MFGERVRHLGEQAAALRAREARLSAAASAEDELFPTPHEISELRQELKAAARHAQAPIRKDLAQSFVHELRVEGRERVIPTFKVVRSAANGRVQVDQANKSPKGTGVRTMTPLAVPADFNPNRAVLVDGPRISLRRRREAR